jgi:hypothetical protein
LADLANLADLKFGGFGGVGIYFKFLRKEGIPARPAERGCPEAETETETEKVV